MARVVPGHGVVAWWLGLEMSERDKKASHQASKNKHAQPPKHSFLPFFLSSFPRFSSKMRTNHMWFATFYPSFYHPATFGKGNRRERNGQRSVVVNKKHDEQTHGKRAKGREDGWLRCALHCLSHTHTHAHTCTHTQHFAFERGTRVIAHNITRSLAISPVSLPLLSTSLLA